jgi:hypothetical protein
MVANMTKLVAVDAGIQSGAIVYWRLAGEMPRAELCGRLDAAGLGRLHPRTITEEQALRRALDEVKGPRLLVRPLGQRGRWAVVAERLVSDRLEHVEVMRARITPQGEMLLDVTDADTSTYALRDRVRAAYDHALITLAQGDISSWLVNQAMQALDAVSLRDTGGVYFIPRDRVELLETLATVLGGDQTIFRIPAMHSNDAADAVLAAIETESAANIADVERWLAETTEKGERVRKARAADMAAVRAKLTRYEDLFGRRLSGIGARLGAVRNRLAGIAVVLDAAADGRETTGRLLDLRDDMSATPAAPDDAPDGAVNRFRQLEID